MSNLIQLHKSIKTLQISNIKEAEKLSLVLSDKWKVSNIKEKEGYLSHLLHQWSIYGAQIIDRDLKLNKFIDWTTSRNDIPLWMDFFIKDNSTSSVYLHSKTGLECWSAWFDNLSEKIDDIQSFWAPIDSFNFEIENNYSSSSPSQRRTVSLIKSIPNSFPHLSNIISNLSNSSKSLNKDDKDILSSVWNVIRIYIKIADQQEKIGVDHKINQFAGTLCEYLSLIIYNVGNNIDIPNDIKSWWDKGDDIIHQSFFTLNNKKTLGLVGRPEYLFQMLMFKMINDNFNKFSSNIDENEKVKRISKIERDFWLFSKKRFEENDNFKSSNIFLPSFHALSKNINESISSLPTDVVLNITSYLQKSILTAETGSWHFLDNENDSKSSIDKPSRKIRKI